VLKVELHAHTDQDPADRLPHTTAELVDRAAALGYDALAVTLHDRYFDPAPHAAYAASRNIVLLSGIERTIEGRHVLLINFPPAVVEVRSFADIEALKRTTNGLVVAPHAFYPVASALRRELDLQVAVVDAIEINSMFTRLIDFNTSAASWARTNGKPLVGNTDLHLLEQLGTTYSLVDADRTPDAICAAIRAGRVVVRSEPLTLVRATWTFARMAWLGFLGRLAGARYE
jgi:predicted metal-dependent phosphoesterase TrpH